MNKRIIVCTMIIAVLASMVFSGCKAKPGEPAGFANASIMQQDEALPFHGVWIKAGVNLRKYDKIYVTPVNTSYVYRQSWWQHTNRYNEFYDDVETVAEFMRETFIDAFKDDPNDRFKVVKHPSADTLILEMAITEFTPNKPFLKVGSYAPFGAGLAVSLINTTNLSVVAFEARIRDGGTGEIIAKAMDREQEKKYLATKKHLYWYSHARGIIEDWADQFVAIANMQPGDIIEDTKPYDWKMW